MHQSFFKADLETRGERKVAKDAEREKAWRICCKAVDARDRRMCRCCGKKTNPDDIGLIRGHRHHLVYRSAGGEDTAQNVLTLCWGHHNAEHKGRLQIVVLDASRGADGPCEFWIKGDDGELFLSKRELGVHQAEKD